MVERYALSGTESQGGGGRAACLEFPDAIHDTGSEAGGPCGTSTLECSREPLAQTVEHLPFKQGVPGSSPGRLTSFFEYFHGSLPGRDEFCYHFATTCLRGSVIEPIHRHL